VKCPACSHDEHRALRADAKDGIVRRRRECLKCTFRWTTIEAPEEVFQRAQNVIDKFRDLQRICGEE
jgi:transcriptional regulator NrdR family protein